MGGSFHSYVAVYQRVPPNHPCFLGFFMMFHEINHPAIGYPHRTNHEPPILWAVKIRLHWTKLWLIHSCCSLRDLSAAWESIPAVRKGADRRIMTIQREMWCWLVVSNMKFIFHFIYGMSSFPLTNSIIFQDGHIAPPTRMKCISRSQQLVLIWLGEMITKQWIWGYPLFSWKRYGVL